MLCELVVRDVILYKIFDLEMIYKMKMREDREGLRPMAAVCFRRPQLGNTLRSCKEIRQYIKSDAVNHEQD